MDTATEGKVSIRAEGPNVLMFVAGKTGVMSPEQTRELIRHLRNACSLAEEHRNAEQVAIDQAILFRSGLPVGLSDNPHIRKMAGVEMAHNKMIRGSHVGFKGIPSGFIPGKPSVRQDVPLAERVARFTEAEREEWRRVLEGRFPND